MSDWLAAPHDDHPSMVAGRAALRRRLWTFVDYEFAAKCHSPPCRFRRFPVAPIAAAWPRITVAKALDKQMAHMSLLTRRLTRN